MAGTWVSAVAVLGGALAMADLIFIGKRGRFPLDSISPSCAQGRGGPGMASSADAQKQSTAAPVVGDTSLHQLVGLAPAIHAASVMAGVLGGAQTANVQNGLPVQFGLGNDPLTHYP